MNKYLIKDTDTMRMALERLSVLVNTLVVVGRAGTCLGTITDGDIRMAVLNGYQLDTSVAQIMNSCPVTGRTSDSSECLSEKFDAVGRYGLPLLDSEGHLVDLLFRESLGVLSLNERRDTCGFILAGGLGSRLRPYTAKIPKPLLKIGRKSILENIIELHKTFGIYDIFLSVNYLGEQVEERFGDGKDFGVRIEYVREETALGTAGPLALMRERLAAFDRVVIMNGDLVTDVNLGSMLAEHDLRGSDLTVAVVQKEFENPFGVVSISPAGEITEILEKPVYKEFVSAGIYCVSTPVLGHVRDGVMDMPELIKSMIDAGEKVSAFSIFESWDDVGFPSDLERLRAKRVEP